MPRERQLLSMLEQKVDPANAAVVVIDVQNDFAHEDGWGASVGWHVGLIQAAARRLTGFLERARAAGVPIVFIQATYDDRYLSDAMVERNQRRGLTEPRCQTGSWGADFYLVRPEPDEPVVVKHRYNAFAETELATVLRRLGARSLLLTGVYTEGCVESTARDAYFRDYYVVMVDDCCGSATEAEHRGTLERCDREFGQVATSDEIVAAWQRLGVLDREVAAGRT